MATKKSAPATKRLSLRVPSQLSKSIDGLRNKKVGAASLNNWILEAMSEKVSRDEQHINQGKLFGEMQ
jgi:predicted HicB family RNase H-like nuclease